MIGDGEEKNGECEEDILPIGGKPEEAADLKKHLKMLQDLCRASSKLLKQLKDFPELLPANTLTPFVLKDCA